MEIRLADFIKGTRQGEAAADIIGKCVHCGFCTATCPTYQLLGNELDSPRGRIYLIKQVLEGQPATEKTRLHLDRCLTCRSCETTCPSGVQYGRLVDIGRELVEQQAPRPMAEKLLRNSLRHALSRSVLFTPMIRLGQMLRPLMPSLLKQQTPKRIKPGQWPAPRHPRKMLILAGCVQPGMAPHFNTTAARVLDMLGISLLTANGAGCCGALNHHLSAVEDGLDNMRRNIDAWWPHIESGSEAIVMTASGCGTVVKEYGHLLAHDPDYAEKAARVSTLTKDLGEILVQEDLTPLKEHLDTRYPIAFHAPCTLQHGQKLTGVVEKLLEQLGFKLTAVPDAHLCCGSAGTYSILQRQLSEQLLHNKLTALQSGSPGKIATANIGCWSHLSTGAQVPVVHWVELLDKAD